MARATGAGPERPAFGPGVRRNRQPAQEHGDAHLDLRPAHRASETSGACAVVSYRSSTRPGGGTTHGSSSGPTVFWWNSVGLVPVCPPAVFTGNRASNGDRFPHVLSAETLRGAPRRPMTGMPIASFAELEVACNPQHRTRSVGVFGSAYPLILEGKRCGVGRSAFIAAGGGRGWRRHGERRCFG